MDKYENVKMVGRGAHGTVHLCRRRADSKLVIIKEIPIDDVSREERQVALNEARVLAMLKHPNIIDYYDSFLEDKVLLIVMEYAEGGTIFEYLQQHEGFVDEEEVMRLFVQIVIAVQYVHSHNILHRDLKTQNILLDRTQLLVKVCDFGISKVLSTKTKEASTVVGTPCYISPELCEGKAYNQKSDVWALGCILYELATRNRAFEASTLPALVMKIMRGTITPISSHYSKELRQLIRKLLHIDPQQRPRTNEVLGESICMKSFLDLHCTLGLMPLTLDPKSLASRSRSSMHKVEVPSAPPSADSGAAASARAAEPTKPLVRKSEVLIWGGGYTDPTVLKLSPDDGSTASKVALGRAQRLVLTSTGKVLSWKSSKPGSEYLLPSRRQKSSSQLSPGRGADREPPVTACWQHIDGLLPVVITQVACGDLFAAILSNRGILMTFGAGDRGALGHGTSEDISTPRIVEALVTESVELIACGANHMAAATGGGDVFTWGNGSYGCLGNASEDSVLRPFLAKKLSKGRPSALHCGMDCTMIVDASGHLFVCGSNRFNKLALSCDKTLKECQSPDDGASLFTEVPLTSFNGQRLKAVSAGPSHSAMITESGAVFTVGSNSFGQLGYETSEDEVCRPRVVSVLASHWMRHITCGDTFTVAGTKDQLFAWGNSKRGRLGSSHEGREQHAPVEVRLHQKFHVLSLEASHGTTIAAVTRQ